MMTILVITTLKTMSVLNQSTAIKAFITREFATGRKCMIVAPTGSGKTVTIPRLCTELGFSNICTVPTRLALSAITKYHRDNFTGVMPQYVTPRMLLRFLLSRKQIPDVVILDEIHTMASIQLLIDALLLEPCYSKIKVIYMTATYTPGFRLATELDAVPRYTITGQTHPIRIVYGETEVTDLVLSHLDDAMDRGTVENCLIFTDSISSVDKMAERIREAVDETEHANLVLVTKAHGDLEDEELKLNLEPFDGIKIIVATNMAESSVTIPDVAVVIDTMVERALVKIGTSYRLSTVKISKSSAQQRAGRTGRTCPGTVYRLCWDWEYNQLPASKGATIFDDKTNNVILQIIRSGFNPVTLYGRCGALIDENIETLVKYGFLTDLYADPTDSLAGSGEDSDSDSERESDSISSESESESTSESDQEEDEDQNWTSTALSRFAALLSDDAPISGKKGQKKDEKKSKKSKKSASLIESDSDTDDSFEVPLQVDGRYRVTEKGVWMINSDLSTDLCNLCWRSRDSPLFSAVVGVACLIEHFDRKLINYPPRRGVTDSRFAEVCMDFYRGLDKSLLGKDTITTLINIWALLMAMPKVTNVELRRLNLCPRDIIAALSSYRQACRKLGLDKLAGFDKDQVYALIKAGVENVYPTNGMSRRFNRFEMHSLLNEETDQVYVIKTSPTSQQPIISIFMNT